MACAPDQGAQALLRYVPMGMYGPPEKCYDTEISDYPGIIARRAGSGLCAVLPWQIGSSQYGLFPTLAVAGLFQAVLDGVMKLPRSITVEAPPLVEVSAFVRPSDGALLLGLANLIGQNGAMVHPPLPVHDLRFRLPGFQGPARVETLTQGELHSEGMPDGEW